MKLRLLYIALLGVSYNSFAGSLDSNLHKPFHFPSNYIIMADPQAWRLGQGADYPDPNSPYSARGWVNFNQKVVSGINKLHALRGSRFGIINGDITEFGRRTQRRSFDSTYSNLRFPYLIGLGNHDYEANVNDCADPSMLNFSMNACAYSTLSDLNDRINKYKNQFVNFDVDSARVEKETTQGSQAYSWDSSSPGHTDHFVQLHLAPNYKVWIDNMAISHNYDILDSISWLRHDLYKARKRGVKNIFINFHALERLKNASPDQQRQLKAIFKEYKISAVFVGHTHLPRMERHELFGDTPVYTTGALYSGYVDFLQVDSEGHRVESYQTSSGNPVSVRTRGKVPTPTPPDMCRKYGTRIAAGSYVRTEIVNSTHPYFYLRQVNTLNALDANSAGDVYTNRFTTTNPYMRWKIQPYYTNANGENYYTITHIKSGKALDSNSNGDVYTKEWNAGRYQQWKLLKYANGSKVQLVNAATGRILDANSKQKVKTQQSSLKFTNGYQNWEIVNPGNVPAENIKYFQAKSPNSWNQPLPRGRSDNQYWSYAGERSLTEAAPCI